MRRRALILLLPLLPFVAGCAAATAGDESVSPVTPVAERPTYVPGDKWIYLRNGQRYEIEFLKYDGEFVIWRRNRNGAIELLYSSPDGNEIRVTAEDGTLLHDNQGEYALYRFPLAVGKSWESDYIFRARATRRTLSARVTAYEQITVPAGTFWAFKIEVVNQARDRRRPAYETLWYAPEVKRMVKYVSPPSSGFNVDIELVEYHLGK